MIQIASNRIITHCLSSFGSAFHDASISSDPSVTVQPYFDVHQTFTIIQVNAALGNGNGKRENFGRDRSLQQLTRAEQYDTTGGAKKVVTMVGARGATHT